MPSSKMDYKKILARYDYKLLHSIHKFIFLVFLFLGQLSLLDLLDSALHDHIRNFYVQPRPELISPKLQREQAHGRFPTSERFSAIEVRSGCRYRFFLLCCDVVTTCTSFRSFHLAQAAPFRSELMDSPLESGLACDYFELQLEFVLCEFVNDPATTPPPW